MPKEKVPEKKQNNDESPEYKAKLKSKRCCCLGLIVVFVIFITLISIRSCIRPKADVDISKIIPSPTLSNTNTKTATPPTNVPRDTIPQENQPAQNNNESISNDPYPKENVINFFVDAAVKNTDGSPSPLGHFTKSTISLKVIGAIPSQASADTLQRVIDDFNSISQNVKLEHNDTGSDLQVFFIPKSEFGNYTNSPNGKEGFSVSVPNSNCQYKYSKVYIANDPDIDQDTRDYLIRHEIMHAIGFAGHNEPTSGSIMGNRIKQEHVGELDIKLIKMLYESGIPLCSNETQVRSYLANANW